MEDKETSVTEAALAAAIAVRMSGEEPALAKAALPSLEPLTGEVTPFEFDEGFQSRVATLVMRDPEFMNTAGHLIRPEYFENAAEASLVNIAVRYYMKYKRLPDGVPIWRSLLKDDKAAKLIRDEGMKPVMEKLVEVFRASLADRDYVEEKVAAFVREQAMTAAIYRSADLLKAGKYEQIEDVVSKAMVVGLNQDGDGYDYFQSIKARSDDRRDTASGIRPAQGITTGNIKMDELLYHRGWGRKELSIIMGGAKAGKTTALLNFAKSASMARKTVLYVTCEVSKEIIAERLDASISSTMVKELSKKINDVEQKIEEAMAYCGKLLIHEYPSGTLTPNMLRGLINRYKAQGIIFDLVVVDYADIMAPNHRMNDSIENTKSVYLDLRAIASEENLAMLTATQTNREGFKSTVAKAEHVAEDFNKVRTADIIISINATDEERSRGEARLYFAASRNQESGFTMFIKQDLAKMQFMQAILRIE